MKKIAILFLLFSFLISMTSCGKINVPEETVPVESSLPETEKTVPVISYPTDGTDYIRLPDGVRPEMLFADFWLDLDKTEETALMNPSEITAFNQANSNLITWGEENISLNDIPETATKDVLLSYIDTAIPSEPEKYHIHGEPATAAYFEALNENRAIDKIEETEEIRFGYSVKRAELRLYPTDDFGVIDPDDLVYDDLLMSQCYPYCPLVILHESRDGNWYYVFFNGFGGWVRADAVAVCESREDWLARQNPEEFLIVTGREIRLPHDEGCPEVSELLLPMGTKLPLVKPENTPEKIRMRIGYGCFTVKVPVRGENGLLRDEYVLVSSAEDLSVGYLPYTHKNVVRLAFRLLGDRYGWGGSGLSNDCSGTLREIYACFGIELPRVAALQIACKGLTVTDLSELSDVDKAKTISGLPIGSMLFFPGHIMIYIGTVDGVNYVISSVGNFADAKTPVGETMEVNTYCINNLEATFRANGKTWLANLTKAGFPAPSNP